MEKSTSICPAPIRMGQMSVAANGDQLRTLLGSCVGLALYDRRHKIGGLAHIVLPQAGESNEWPGKFVDTAVPALIEMMKQFAGARLAMVAKIAGGASMFSTTVATNIGLRNIEACEQVLAELGIPIVKKHCGGSQGRRMSLHTSNGRVLIEVVGQDPIEL